jgi:hypothetical protein
MVEWVQHLHHHGELQQQPEKIPAALIISQAVVQAVESEYPAEPEALAAVAQTTRPERQTLVAAAVAVNLQAALVAQADQES